MERIIIRGVIAGLFVAALLAMVDAATAGKYLFGLRTAIVGLLTGGIALVLGFAMAATSYWLASRGRALGLRRRLLSTAVFCGAAGMTLSFAVAGLWAVAGRPFFT